MKIKEKRNGRKKLKETENRKEKRKRDNGWNSKRKRKRNRRKGGRDRAKKHYYIDGEGGNNYEGKNE